MLTQFNAPASDRATRTVLVVDDDPDARRIAATVLTAEGYGVIVRTAAENATRDELERDVTRLVRLWEEIDKRSATAKPPPTSPHST